MKWAISTPIDSTKANSFLSRMHKSMGNSIINIEKERLYREGSSQEKNVSSVRFQPGTSRFEKLNLSGLSIHHDHGLRLVLILEKLGTYYQNFSFFEAENK